MQLLETTNQKTGTVRYYADGKRISREQMRSIKSCHDLDTFHTVIKRGYIRDYAHARTHKPA